MRGLIVEEFSGRPPGDAALGDLATYVRAVKPCPGRSDEPVRLAARIDLFRDSIRSAARAAAAGDAQTAAVLTGAARWQLGLIDERLAVGQHRAARNDLLQTSRRLQAIRDGTIAPPPLLAILARFDQQAAPRLIQSETTSLYRPEVVDRWLAERSR